MFAFWVGFRLQFRLEPRSCRLVKSYLGVGEVYDEKGKDNLLIETELLDIESVLPEAETALPQMETTLPEFEQGCLDFM